MKTRPYTSCDLPSVGDRVQIWYPGIQDEDILRTGQVDVMRRTMGDVVGNVIDVDDFNCGIDLVVVDFPEGTVVPEPYQHEHPHRGLFLPEELRPFTEPQYRVRRYRSTNESIGDGPIPQFRDGDRVVVRRDFNSQNLVMRWGGMCVGGVPLNTEFLGRRATIIRHYGSRYPHLVYIKIDGRNREDLTDPYALDPEIPDASRMYKSRRHRPRPTNESAGETPGYTLKIGDAVIWHEKGDCTRSHISQEQYDAVSDVLRGRVGRVVKTGSRRFVAIFEGMDFTKSIDGVNLHSHEFSERDFATLFLHEILPMMDASKMYKSRRHRPS